LGGGRGFFFGPPNILSRLNAVFPDELPILFYFLPALIGIALS
jgi:hypothetical protein